MNSNGAKTQASAKASNDENSANNATQDIIKSKNKSGRLSHQQYLNSEVTIKHQQYKAGELCPTECGARLWNSTPGTVIKTSGQGLAKTTQYNIEKLRCSLCGHYLY